VKRASLSALPARPRAEPEDLTDRLLDREVASPAQAPVPEEAAAAAPPTATPEVAPTPAPKRATRARVRAAEQAQPAPEAGPAELSISAALQQASDAADALKQAARGEPARYELALRYRLEALAHHVQQVAEFISGRSQR
jgi:hypothetical protein